jgi:hypothetical protein
MAGRKTSERGAGTVVPVRLPADVLEEVDRLRQQLEDERPGLRVTRSDALRILIMRGLRYSEAGGSGSGRGPAR